jgi:hypothetical protein
MGPDIMSFVKTAGALTNIPWTPPLFDVVMNRRARHVLRDDVLRLPDFHRFVFLCRRAAHTRRGDFERMQLRSNLQNQLFHCRVLKISLRHSGLMGHFEKGNPG